MTKKQQDEELTAKMFRHYADFIVHGYCSHDLTLVVREIVQTLLTVSVCDRIPPHRRDLITQLGVDLIKQSETL